VPLLRSGRSGEAYVASPGRLVCLPEVWPHGAPRETRVQMLLSEVRRVEAGSLSDMRDEKHILRILGEATEPLSPSEITDRLNHELGAGSPTQ